MIYIANKTEAQEVYVPRALGGLGGDGYLLRLTDTVSLDYVEVEVSDALGESSRYMKFSFALPSSVTSGEHRYEVIDKATGAVAARGLCVLTEKPGQPYEYEKVIQYEQYKRED